MSDILQTRREFLRKGIYFVAASATAPFFLTRTALALDNLVANAGTRSLPGVPDDRILVVIQMSGGNDGLNTVVPYAMDEYYRVRPTLGIEKSRVLKLNDTLGLHPQLAKLKDLYDAGKVAVVQGVGYPNPDRSHFRSMDIWHTADPKSKVVNHGWLGRYLDNACPGCDPVTKKVNPLGGINIGGDMPVALKSARGGSIALENPDAFTWQPLIEEKSDAKRASATFEKLNNIVAKNLDDPQVARLDFLSRVAMNADVSSDRIRDVTKRARATGTYPTSGLARQLKIVAQMITGGLNTRVYYCAFGGFDTHANEPVTHERLLGEFADAVSAFQRDLEARDQAGRVLTVTFSEFGRRVAQNASNGTDHGAAAPLFVIGGRLKAGLYGTHPSLTNLDRGDLRFSTDFRSVYATVLENWLGAKSAPILGQQFDKLKFV
ncbi:MAG: hypothetical protein PCFJNLEI_04025 [Verrucomicrobiae bacterium]|nr:hypothetical protein [Verrucomicrobiae bacterium]